MKQFIKKIIKQRFLLMLLLVIGIGLLSHGMNVTRYPAYFDDEGTYMSQAWSVLELGKLAPYTYWYDHAPLGWIIIAGWIKLVGGFFTFGTSIDTGRVFMVILHAISTGLVFYTVFKVTGKTTIAAVASLLFSLSPMAVTLQRMVFLDNIMMTFLLASLAALVHNKRLLLYIISGTLFGLAILIKETAVFLAPAYLGFIFIFAHKRTRLFAGGLWIALVASIVATYFLYALIKGEFFPAGSLFGGETEHVSLLETLSWQSSRKGGHFLDPESEFQFMLKNSWWQADKYLLISGTIAMIVNFLLGIKRTSYLAFALLPLLYILYLIRGGIVMDQYIIPLIPFYSMNIALTLFAVYSLIVKWKFTRNLSLLPLMLLLGGFLFFYSNQTQPYLQDKTRNQKDSIEWIKRNTSPDDLVVVDAYSFVDLRESSNKKVYAVSGVHHYWKIDSDPFFREQLLENDWTHINYIVATPKFEKDVIRDNLVMLQQAMHNSHVITKLKNKELSDTNNSPVTTMGVGGDITIYKMQDFDNISLTQSWDFYKVGFIKPEGKVVDPDRDITTSEGQSYAMLRAVWQNDRETFDTVWNWTQDHFQHRESDSLFSWIWEKENGDFKVTDPNTASDADQDIALALLFASQKWQNNKYYQEAQEIMSDIWEHEVVEINSRFYLGANTSAQHEISILVNPSYLSPATYKIFALYDPSRPWNKLADDSYDFLLQLQSYSQLPPNWIMVDSTSGALSSAEGIVDKADVYGYDAFRVMWRVALDYQWFGDLRAKQYLTPYYHFYLEQLEQHGNIPAEYTVTGQPLSNYSDLSSKTGPLATFTVLDKKRANDFYKKHYVSNFDYLEGYWNEKDNYYSQNWAWFSTALYSNNLPILLQASTKITQ